MFNKVLLFTFSITFVLYYWSFWNLCFWKVFFFNACWEFNCFSFN